MISALYSLLPVSNKPPGSHVIGMTLGGTKERFLNKHIVKFFFELHSGCIKFYDLNEDSVGYSAGLHPSQASESRVKSSHL